jgi:antimicrobial peptide system SdpA family protein
MTGRDAPTLRATGSAGVGVLAIVLVGFWLLFGTYVVHTRMPRTALTLPGENALKPLMILFVPEGWAFFTKDPRDERYLSFVRGSDGRWAFIDRGPNAEPRNWFGLNRLARAQGPEIGVLVSRVPAPAWQDCNIEPTQCLDRSPVAYRGATPSPIPALCGSVGIVVQRPLPWAWFSAREEVVLPSRVARLEISC